MTYCDQATWGDPDYRWGDTRVDWAGRVRCPPTIPDDECVIAIALDTGTVSLAFDATEDADGNAWIYQNLDGWWEPPAIDYSTVVLGGDYGEIVTNARYKPRTITLRAFVKTGDVMKARQKLTALADLPGTLTVDDSFSARYANVELADVPRSRVATGGLEVEFPMVAHDAYRHDVTTDVGRV